MHGTLRGNFLGLVSRNKELRRLDGLSCPMACSKVATVSCWQTMEVSVCERWRRLGCVSVSRHMMSGANHGAWDCSAIRKALKSFFVSHLEGRHFNVFLFASKYFFASPTRVGHAPLPAPRCHAPWNALPWNALPCAVYTSILHARDHTSPAHHFSVLCPNL